MNLLQGSLLTLGMLLIMHTGFSQEKKDTLKQEGKKDTLKLSVAQAQQCALDNNRSILNANLDVESAKKRVWEITASGLPQVSAKGTFQYMPTLSSTISEISSLNQLGSWMYLVDQNLHNANPSDQNFGHIPPPGPATNPNDLKWSLTADLTVSQLLFSGSYLVGLQSAKVYKNLSALNQVKSKQDVLESITNSYFNVLIARENSMILDSTYRNLSQTLVDMQKMNKQGFIEETDVDQMQITLSNVKTSLDFITRQQEIAEKLLKLQLGVDLNKPIVLTDDLKLLVNALTIDKLLLADLVMEDNVNYQMLDAQVRVSELLLKLHKFEFLPDFAAFYQREKSFNTKAFTFNPPDLIGVSLNIPIFSSGARLSRVSQAKNDLLKAKNNKAQAVDGLWVDFYNSKSALLNALDNYNTSSNNLQLAKKIYNRSLIKYTNGMLSNIELTQVQNQFLTAQSNYYTAIQNLITSKNKLEKMLSKN